MRYRDWALVMVAAGMLASVPQMWGQSFPAGAQGTWKVVKKLDVPLNTMECLGGLSKARKGSEISIGEHTFLLDGQGMSAVQPKVHTVTSAAFAQEYLGGSEAAFKHLGLSASKLEIITPGGGAPFDLVIVKGPSTLLFERCGQYFEGVHAGGFRAPKLPNP